MFATLHFLCKCVVTDLGDTVRIVVDSDECHVETPFAGRALPLQRCVHIVFFMYSQSRDMCFRADEVVAYGGSCSQVRREARL